MSRQRSRRSPWPFRVFKSTRSKFSFKNRSTPAILRKTSLPTHALAMFFLAANPLSRFARPIPDFPNHMASIGSHRDNLHAFSGLRRTRTILSDQRVPQSRIHSQAGIEYPPPFRPFDSIFKLPVMDGFCVGVHLPNEGGLSAPIGELHPLEVEALSHMKPHRQVNFAGGRIAIRRAIKAIGVAKLAHLPLLYDEHGAPTFAPGILGSISHSRDMAVGFTCSAASIGEECVAHNSVNDLVDEGERASLCAVGVDVENSLRAVNLKLAKRTLADDERQTLGVLTGFSMGSDLLLRISIKEALYKALHPLVRQVIHWHSVQIQPNFDGTCTVNATKLEQAVNGTIVANASWRLHNGYFLSFATAVFKPER